MGVVSLQAERLKREFGEKYPRTGDDKRPPQKPKGQRNVNVPSTDQYVPTTARGVLAVCGFQGGVGRTTVTAHVLRTLAEHVAPVVAVDAGRPFPMLGQAVGTWRTTGFRDALHGASLRWCLAATAVEGVDLLASSFTTLPDQPDPDDVAGLLKQLANFFAWVVVDTPSDPDAGELRGALMAATTVLWVVNGRPEGLERVQALGRVLAPAADHAVVLNQMEGDITPPDIEQFLDMPVALTIPTGDV